MADIELVIKIPEETYEYWKNHSHEYVLAEAIKKGTPLPKGHGRLIDADKLCQTPIDSTDLPIGECLMVYDLDEIENAPTIIEADKAESEG